MKPNWAVIKEATEGIKNICTLICYVVVTLLFVLVVWPKIGEFDINKINLGLVEMTHKEKQALKTIDTVSNNSLLGKDTGVISLPLFDAAKFLDTTLNVGSQNWVYLGR